MKVILINPPYSKEDRYGKDLGKFGPLNEPLGLAYLAATLEQEGHKVEIFDAPALNLTSSDICNKIEVEPCDLVGVTMLTPMYTRSMEVIKALRKVIPPLKIVVGGAHPTILPEKTLHENREIDFAIMGEGEFALRDLVHALEKGERLDHVVGLASRKDGQIVVNEPSPLIENLDDLPLPARHLLPMTEYQMTKSRSRSGHAFTVSVARGCPFNCAFCCRIFGRKVRHHSVDRIIQEINILVNDYDAQEINLEADTITLNKTFLTSLCDALIDSGLARKVTWTCESRVDTVTEEMLRKMKAAGCWQISYGVESGSQRLLDLIQKGITLEQIQDTFKFTKKIGISIRAFFMLGLPTETREESLKTISFARKLDARWSQFTICTPFPGTELYDLAIQDGGLRAKSWSDFKTHGGWTAGDLAYVPKGRSVNEIKEIQKKAYRVVYLRPKVIFRFLRDIDSIKKIKEYWTGFWVLIKTRFSSSSSLKRVIRVDRNQLQEFATGVYVDSPVYFARNPLVRGLNWWKLHGVLPFLLKGEYKTVLDFACGNGIMFPTLSRLFKVTIGVDLHVAAASRLKDNFRLNNIDLISGDGMALPIKDASFDLVLAFSSLEHFPDLDFVLDEIFRVLKKNGKLLFLSPSENIFYRMGRRLFGYQKPQDHYYSAKEIMRFIEKKFNLEVKRYFPLYVFPFLSIYFICQFRKSE
jgi:radical SAM superfamily enzyme YgiQ (UPF0313 family)/ubiquinone/menaquinone biosynthesis C-methylase UbiE